ncbi:MAG: AAA family ATPase, partial [Clostridia bacterium]|nr:AAA family ATPase [Clostridia bacterium]
MRYSDIAELSERICAEIGKAVIGHGRDIALLTCSLICGGHVLIEDVPGTGKTTLARALAAAVEGRFARVQFTPDLLPADITGMTVYRPENGTFEFLRGPVFTNILLADEVNRATPRTQSALLECMAEGQVTENGVTYALAKPFFVIATENPVETQGTFPLP